MFVSEEKQPDQLRSVAFLAQEFHVPVADVAKLYKHEHAELAIGAHITKFLHIFAIRNVEEILRKRGIERLAVPAAGLRMLAAERLLMPLGSTWPTNVAEKPQRP